MIEETLVEEVVEETVEEPQPKVDTVAENMINLRLIAQRESIRAQQAEDRIKELERRQQPTEIDTR